MGAQTRRLCLLLVLVILCLPGLLVPAALAGTTPQAIQSAAPPVTTSPPASSLVQQVDALVGPSLDFLSITATGTVDVPWSDGSTRRVVVTPGFQATVFCSGSNISDAGLVLTAGHCLDPAEFINVLIDATYNYLLQNQQIPSGLTPADAEADWTVETGTIQLSVNVYPMVGAATVGDSGPMVANVLYDEPLSQGDVAVLVVSLPAGMTLPALPLAAAVPPVGTAVVSAGFPGSTFGASTANLGTLVPFYGVGNTESEEVIGSAYFFPVSSTIAEGMSGGPTVDLSGQIVGTNSLIQSSNSQDEKISAITDISHIQSVITRHGYTARLSTADVLWRTGMADYWKGLYREAVGQLRLVFAMQPDNLQAQHYLALARADEPLEQEPKPSLTVSSKPTSSLKPALAPQSATSGPIRQHSTRTWLYITLAVALILGTGGIIAWRRLIRPGMRPRVGRGP